jgi:hypothetical protein
VFGDWLEMIETVYPSLLNGPHAKLIKPASHEVDKLSKEGYSGLGRLKEIMLGTKVSDDKKDKMEDIEEEHVLSEEEKTEEEDVGETDQAYSLDAFLVNVSLERSDGPVDNKTFKPSEVAVKHLNVSNERPDTQFGNSQMSHTIPWSMDRLAWSKMFSNITVEELLHKLAVRINEEHDWEGAPGLFNMSESQGMRGSLSNEIAALVNKELTIEDWIDWVNHLIQSYVAQYQKAPFATYGTEVKDGDGTARSKGEPAGLRNFALWEAELEKAPFHDTKKLPKKLDIDKNVNRLLDVPQQNTNRNKVKVDNLVNRWLEDFKVLYPKVYGNYEKDILSAVKDVAPLNAKVVQFDLTAPRQTRNNGDRNGKDYKKLF